MFPRPGGALQGRREKFFLAEHGVPQGKRVEREPVPSAEDFFVAVGPHTSAPAIKQLLGRNRTRFEVRSTSPEELSFEIKLPTNQKTDSLTKSIGALDPESALEWEEKKNKDAA